MMIDSLESVNIMLPNTTIVEASEDVNAELFWGLRGAGFNFGVVLNATYQVYDQVPQGLHLNADFMFPLSQAETYYANLSQLSENQPAPLSVITYFAFDNTTNQVSWQHGLPDSLFRCCADLCDRVSSLPMPSMQVQKTKVDPRSNF